MTAVKLCKGLSYKGYGVAAKAGEVLTVTANRADELVKTGFFDIVDAAAEAGTDSAKEAEGTVTAADVKPKRTRKKS